MSKVFFSYSHRDEAMRDELETHLAILKRQGVIETWHDRRIVAGEELDRALQAWGCTLLIPESHPPDLNNSTCGGIKACSRGRFTRTRHP